MWLDEPRTTLKRKEPEKTNEGTKANSLGMSNSPLANAVQFGLDQRSAALRSATSA